MADLLNWEPGMSVGVAILDEDHRRIMKAINRLYSAMLEGAGKEALSETFHEMMVYINLHFECEEELLEQTHYPDAAEQKAHHMAMAARLKEYRRKYEKDASSVMPVEMLNFLKDWWLDHIMNLDRKYAAHLKAHGIK